MPSIDSVPVWIPDVDHATSALSESENAFDDASRRVTDALRAYRDALKEVQRAKGSQNVGVGLDRYRTINRVARQNAATASQELNEARAAAQTAEEEFESAKKLLRVARYQSSTGRAITTQEEFEEAANDAEDVSESSDVGVFATIASGLEEIGSIF